MAGERGEAECEAAVGEVDGEVDGDLGGEVDCDLGGEVDGEGSGEADWPEVGVQVVVGVEDIMHAARLGDRGVSEGPSPEGGSEVLVKFTHTQAFASVRVPRSLLVPEGSKPRSMKMWDKVSDEVLRGDVGQCGNPGSTSEVD